MTELFGIPLSALLSQLLLGLVNGSFYAMLSLGLAVIFGLLNVINFAHGALYMMGAIFAWMGLTYFGINYWVMLIVAPLLVGLFGIIGFIMERNGYPVAAMVLGIVMGTMVEQSFVTSLIKSDGDVLPFFERPVSAVLAAMAIAALLWPAAVWMLRRLRPAEPAR